MEEDPRIILIKKFVKAFDISFRVKYNNIVSERMKNMLCYEELRLSLIENEKPLKELADAIGLEILLEEVDRVLHFGIGAVDDFLCSIC